MEKWNLTPGSHVEVELYSTVNVDELVEKFTGIVLAKISERELFNVGGDSITVEERYLVYNGARIFCMARYIDSYIDFNMETAYYERNYSYSKLQYIDHWKSCELPDLDWEIAHEDFLPF